MDQTSAADNQNPIDGESSPGISDGEKRERLNMLKVYFANY